MVTPARELAARERAEATSRERRSWLTPAGRRYFLLVYGLVIIGLVFVFSSSYPQAGRPTEQGGNPYSYFWAQLRYAMFGLLGMVLVARMRLAQVARLAPWGFALGCLLMIAAIIWGRQVHGALCWLPKPVPWQPSEFAKVAYLVLVAGCLARGPLPRESVGRIWLPLFAATALMAFILLWQRDLGMAMLIVGFALGMALVGGMRWVYWIPLALGTGAAGLLVAKMHPHAWVRLEAWLHPEQHVPGPGLHVYNMLIALARGGLGGRGLGFSPDKWTTLPFPHTDSIFCVIGGELGLWGGMGLIALIAFLAIWAFAVARHCPHRLGFFVASAAGMMLALQGFINIAVATASMPVTGLTLPFISAGGSSLISCLLTAGLVLSVAAEGSARGEG